MKARWAKLALMCGVAVAVVMHPVMTFECGPWATLPVFVTRQPEDLDEFMRGNLGVLRPTFQRRNLLIAYRALSGAPLTAVEQESLRTQLKTLSSWSYYSAEKSPYIKERNALPGIPSARMVGQFKHGHDYMNYLNCGDDAIENAAATLRSRVQQYGAGSQEVREWALAQDRVFENCDKDEVSIPGEVDANASSQVKADREYQIAAANFYAGRFEEAAVRFESIGAKKDSTWHDWGLYLAGRAYIRKATLKSSSEQEEDAALRRAEKFLQKVIDDPELAKMKPKAERLLEFVEIRLDPEERAAVLYRSLSKASQDVDFNQHVVDYLKLIPDTRAQDDEMADWIDIVGGSKAEEAIARWKREPRSVVWLVAALMNEKGEGENASALIEAGRRISEKSAAYPTVLYSIGRLLSEQGKRAEARKVADEFLSKYSGKMSQANLNLVLALRTANAASLEDFSRFAQRKTIATTDDLSEYSGDALCKPTDDGCEDIPDVEASKVINHLPIQSLLSLARMESTAKGVRITAARIAFTRSLLLGDDAKLVESGKLLSELSPRFGRDLSAVRSASTAKQRRIEATLALMSWPGGSYKIDPANYRFIWNGDRMRELTHLLSYGSVNWWCDQGRDFPPETRGIVPTTNTSSLSTGYPAFLTASERKIAERQLRAMEEADAPPVFFGKAIMAWSSESPDDPRVPSALQGLVRAVHFGCGGGASTRIGKAAFQRLHERYPKSIEAKRTKYWYEAPSF